MPVPSLARVDFLATMLPVRARIIRENNPCSAFPYVDADAATPTSQAP